MKPDLPPIQSVIEKLLEKLGFKNPRVTIKSSVIPGHVVYDIELEDSALLIGRGGQNLQALSRLVRDIVISSHVKKSSRQSNRYDLENFVVDVNGYQEEEVKTLLKQVKGAVARLKTGDQQTLPLSPMTSFERRIVHAYAADHEALESHSEGVGPNRHVVISRYNNANE